MPAPPTGLLLRHRCCEIENLFIRTSDVKCKIIRTLYKILKKVAAERLSLLLAIYNYKAYFYLSRPNKLTL